MVVFALGKNLLFESVLGHCVDVKFHLQKQLEIFDTNSADNFQSLNYKGAG